MTNDRKPKNVEVFQVLSEILELSGGKFAKQVGKQASNVADYLSGKKVPGNRVLRNAMQHAFEWDITPIVELEEIKQSNRQLPGEPGIYALYDSAGNVLYIGQASNLRKEVSQTLNRDCNFPVRVGGNLSFKARPKYKAIAKYMSAYKVASPRVRHNLEALLLRMIPNQSHNNKIGKFR